MGNSGSTWDAPPKKDVARALLLRGSVFLHLDPRLESVHVPRYLSNQPQLILQVGLDMPTPIPDLRVDDRGMFGTLSFNRTPFHCTVPWESVFAMQSEEGRMMLWPESLPEELRAEVERELGRPGLEGHARRLKVVDGGAQQLAGGFEPPAFNARDLEPDDDPTLPERPQRKLPPYLRVVK